MGYILNRSRREVLAWGAALSSVLLTRLAFDVTNNLI